MAIKEEMNYDNGNLIGSNVAGLAGYNTFYALQNTIFVYH